jgi:hypothetical protein
MIDNNGSYACFNDDAATLLINKVVENRNTGIINQASINALLAKVNALTKRLNIVESKSTVKVLDNSTVEGYYTSTDKDLAVVDLTMSSTVNPSWALIGNTVEITDSYAENVTLAATATDGGDVTIDNLTTNGILDKSVSNAAIKVNGNGIINIANCSIGQDDYNAIEIGLGNTRPTRITISNCDFDNTSSNNAISIFDTADNCVVTIENCHFASVSNVLRLSNRSNASAVKINFVNCTWDELERNLNYRAVVLCQDYTSATQETVIDRNLFGNGKIEITFTDCTDETGNRVIMPADSSWAGTGEGRLVYVYADHWANGTAGKVSYDEHPEMFPTVSVQNTD